MKLLKNTSLQNLLSKEKYVTVKQVSNIRENTFYDENSLTIATDFKTKTFLKSYAKLSKLSNKSERYKKVDNNKKK